MPGKENNFYKLNVTEYDIAGNILRVWRDENKKIIFVIDDTIDEFKPNVLLVMDSFGDRKWDDVLQNDYGVDLETVRPKRDNLYQKLDIEYYGLDEYEHLITAYENGGNIDEALRSVIEFRDAAARRAVTARLTVAMDAIEQAQETISRTERSLQDMRGRRKKLRAQLAQQRGLVGQEPTKQSASRILRIESQIESNDEKISRAEKRIETAKRRIANAMDDAEKAREFLERRRNNQDLNKDGLDKDLDEINILQVPDDQDDKFDVLSDIESTAQPKEQDMDENEDVKPLLDQDPEILDEEIAFKPVKFDDIEPELGYTNNKNTKSTEDIETREHIAVDFDDGIDESHYESDVNNDTVVRPLSFSPSGQTDDYSDSESKYQNSDGVLDTIKTVEEPVPADIDTTGRITNTQYENNTVVRPATYNNARPVQPTSRPISPISGHEVRPVDNKVNNRPTLAYYLLLILLIGLSVFALWLYQQKNGDNLPMLDPKIRTDKTTEVVDLPTTVETEPVVESVSVQDYAEPEELDVPVVVQQEEDQPINIVYPNENILRAAEPAPLVIESEEDVLSRKEPYNVSQHEKMFVAAGVDTVPEPVVRETNVVSPDVIFDDDIISVPMPAPNYDQEYYEPDAPVQNAGYYNNVYYQEPANNYMEPQQYEYVPNGYDNQRYIQNNLIYEEDVPVNDTQKRLSIHDGGQYSVSYEETSY